MRLRWRDQAGCLADQRRAAAWWIWVRSRWRCVTASWPGPPWTSCRGSARSGPPVAPGVPAPRARARRAPAADPHVAWFSHAGRADLRRKSAETVRDFLLAGRLRNCVNQATLEAAEGRGEHLDGSISRSAAAPSARRSAQGDLIASHGKEAQHAMYRSITQARPGLGRARPRVRQRDRWLVRRSSSVRGGRRGRAR